MKQTVDYLLKIASENDLQALDKVMYLKANIIAEKDKYFILGDE